MAMDLFFLCVGFLCGNIIMFLFLSRHFDQVNQALKKSEAKLAGLISSIEALKKNFP